MSYKLRIIWIFIISWLTAIGFKLSMSLDMLINKTDIVNQYKEMLGKFSMIDLFLFIGIVLFYHWAYKILSPAKYTFADKMWIGLPAFLFANFMIWGMSYEKTDSHDLVLNGVLPFLNAMLIFAVYFILFYVCITVIYFYADRVRLYGKRGPGTDGNRLWAAYKRNFLRYPFIVPFLSMFICYLPYMVSSYPGIMMGDTPSMVLQGYNFPEWTSNYLNLIDEGVRLNGHHAVIYTALIHVCIVIGGALFGSCNIGIFLVAMIQLLAFLTVVSFILRYLVKRGIDFYIVLGIMILFIVSPRTQNYMFLISKDVLCACFLLAFVFCTYRIMREKTTSKWTSWTGFIVSAAGVGLLRNEGKYIVCASIVSLLFLAGKVRKRLLVAGIAVMTLLVGFYEVFMPMCHITPGSVREALSVPFQQTARYVQTWGDEVTEEERETISAVLDYDRLAAEYSPDTSDPIKSMFNEQATRTELKAYFRVWWKMFLKHPDVYVQATANNYYYYFYPGEKMAFFYEYAYSTVCMNVINDDPNFQTLGFEFHHPALFEGFRKIYEVIREGIFSLPILSLLKCPAAYTWILLLWIFYIMRIKKWHLLVFSMPLVFCLGIALLAPCNGYYFRYIYGISICLPIVLVLGMSDICGSPQDRELMK